MYKLLRNTCVLLIGTGSLSISVAAPHTTFSTLVDNWRAQERVPGAVVYVKTSTTTQLINSGVGDTLTKIPIKKTTVFGVGSITKTFISVLILQLEAQKKLKLSDTLGQYMPQYPHWRHITIRHLLNMSSGIPNFTDIPAVKAGLEGRWSPDTLLALAYQQHTHFIPGLRWEYSNTNYLLLGKIIEQVTQQPLQTVLQTRLFTPLHLRSTFYGERAYPQAALARAAHAYYNGMDCTFVSPGNTGAAGAMLMSATDLATWVDHLLIHPDLLPHMQQAELLDTIKIPPTPLHPHRTRFGLGIFTSDDDNMGHIVWYTGVTPQGYSSTFVWIPQRNMLLIAQANSRPDGNFTLLFPNQTLLQTAFAYFAGILSDLLHQSPAVVSAKNAHDIST
ncbi:MAG: hypothetical protein A3J38_10400 [Gammaproteobacteria bacterium RIFCSPHIGHO2_12_FULL_45_9]|nr:MAG: hypothetical protein A3J38_10400 [Gammaproteobacteria bacterium RIFCSPHIGHO2_12_FULL_45_9]